MLQSDVSTVQFKVLKNGRLFISYLQTFSLYLFPKRVIIWRRPNGRSRTKEVYLQPSRRYINYYFIMIMRVYNVTIMFYQNRNLPCHFGPLLGIEERELLHHDEAWCSMHPSFSGVPSLALLFPFLISGPNFGT